MAQNRNLMRVQDSNKDPIDNMIQYYNKAGSSNANLTVPPIKVRDMANGGNSYLDQINQKNNYSPRKEIYDYRSEVSGSNYGDLSLNQGLLRNIGAHHRSFKVSETPQERHSDLNNYLNWVPTKEKLNIAQIQSKKVLGNKLSPLRAGGNNYEDDRRSSMSKTVIQVRDKFSGSQQGDDHLKEISIDGISISGKKQKPRALSNLRTVDSYGMNSPQKVEVSSIFSQNLKNRALGILSPAPKRKILDELSWEDQQKLLGMSLAQVNRLKKNDLLRAVSIPQQNSSGYSKVNSMKRLQSDDYSNIDEALKKIARAGDDFASMKDYAKALIKRFDNNLDGIISFQELCDGLRQFDINLSLKERIALMKKLDVNQDGEISDVELYKALHTVEGQLTREAVDLALKKIASRADNYPNMREYCKALIQKADTNGDGLVSMTELTEGLRKMHINLSVRERQAFMGRIDLNRDGEINHEELFKVLSATNTTFTQKELGDSVANVLVRIVEAGDEFATMKEYSRHLIKQFDSDGDGIISFNELTSGLAKMKILLSNQEKQSLMRKLDIDQDGKITATELQQILSTVDTSGPKKATYQIIDQVLKKIAAGADDLNNMRDYSKQLIKKCDKNNDGIISFLELCDGLKSIGIYLNGSEREALMNRIDTNKDGYITDQEIYKVLSSIDVSQIKQVVKEEADSALKKIASGAADYPSMNDYVKTLMKKFDADSDGVITFNELCDGIKQLNIFLRLKERQALMSILDLNSDGTLTAKELLSVLQNVDVKFSRSQLQEQVDQALRKIASGADEFSSLREYVQVLVSIFDQNQDGYISFNELTEGLKQFKINLTAQEKQGIMRKLDFNKDGEISEEEIFRALQPYDTSKSQMSMAGGRRSPALSPDKVLLSVKERERISVDELIIKIKKGAQKYQSLKHFVAAMMRRYDADNDGYLNFQELSDGLAYDNIKLTKEERLALMKHLDKDCDGVISRDEIFNALLLDSRHRRNHHFTRVNVDHLLKRIKQGAERFKSLQEFVRYLFDKLDTDGSGALSFNELSVGLTNMGIEISNQEKHELMKKLDDDADGEIGYDEFYRGLAEAGKFKQPDQVNPSHLVNIDHALKKIAIGAEQYKCLEDYVIMLFRKFDINKDGAVSFKELREGLNSMNVHLADNEIHALFHQLDADRDGNISQEELYNALISKEKYTKSPHIGQQKVNVDHVLQVIRKGVEKFRSLDEYVNDLMKRFDINGDGSISIDELSQGLKSINVKISEKEKLALMKELDKDRDLGISKEELYNALANGQYSPNKQAREQQQSPMGFQSPKGFASNHLSHGAEQILAKVKKYVSHYKSQQEQIIGLLRIFDLDNDGLISYLELVDGVKSLGIPAKKNDMLELMEHMDKDKDGFITQIELYKAMDLKPMHEGYQGTSVSIDHVLQKLKKGAEKYHNIGEYVNVLFQMFATAGSNFMTFQELMNCLKTFNFNLQHIEKIALMKKMDENGDNQISKEEFYNALTSAAAVVPLKAGQTIQVDRVRDPDEVRVDKALLKIKSGAARFKSLSDYCMFLMKKLDTNKDGFITYLELVEGLREMGIKVFKGEQAAMMRRLDEDRDGVISYDELLKALSNVH